MRETTESMRHLFSKFSSISFISEDFILQHVPPPTPSEMHSKLFHYPRAQGVDTIAYIC